MLIKLLTALAARRADAAQGRAGDQPRNVCFAGLSQAIPHATRQECRGVLAHRHSLFPELLFLHSRSWSIRQAMPIENTEAAKFWPRHERAEKPGVSEVLIAVINGLKGFVAANDYDHLSGVGHVSVKWRLTRAKTALYLSAVIGSIKHKGLRQLFETDNRKGVNAEHVRKLKQILAALAAAQTIEGLDLPTFGLHPLKGDLKGSWAITSARIGASPFSSRAATRPTSTSSTTIEGAWKPWR